MSEKNRAWNVKLRSAQTPLSWDMGQYVEAPTPVEALAKAMEYWGTPAPSASSLPR